MRNVKQVSVANNSSNKHANIIYEYIYSISRRTKAEVKREKKVGGRRCMIVYINNK